MAIISPRKPPKNVDEYLDAQTPEIHALLSHVRELILKTATDAQEVISYRMPAYKYHGMLVGFAAHTNHCSLYMWKAESIDAFAEELKEYSCSAGTIRFTIERPLADDLIVKIIRYRMQENESKRLKKKK